MSQRFFLNHLFGNILFEAIRIKKRPFFKLLKQYRSNPGVSSIQYLCKAKTRVIDPVIEENIIKELSIEKNFCPE
jgi:hypothetical protein